jgi:hypothetical protein
MTRFLDKLRDRWGGGIRPSIGIQGAFIERWDGEGEGDARCISFEAFGVTANLFVGRTPAKRRVSA